MTSRFTASISAIAKGLAFTAERFRDDRDNLRIIADAMSLQITVCSRDLTYRWVSRETAGFIGRSPAELVGRKMVDVLGAPAMDALKPHIERVLSGQPVEHEERVVYKDLGPRWIHALYAPTFGPDKVADGWTALVLDITERKLSEDAALEADRQKDELLAVLGHELRNPVGAISNAAAVLEKLEVGNHAATRAVEIIRRQVSILGRLMDDLFDVGRLIARKIDLVCQPLDLGDAVRRAVRSFEASGQARFHRLEIRIEPAWIDADPVRIEQVASNLIDNALKYTPPGGSIGVSVRSDDRHAVLVVTDSGIGIAKEFMPRLFELFAQAEPQFGGQTSGLGLGLALTKRIVELHRGEIVAESEGPGRGSTFTVSLPLASKQPRESQPSKSGPSNGLRVIVIEDNEDNRESIAELLRLAGHDVVTASDGAKGFELALDVQPEAAIVDIALPTWNGYEVSRRLREKLVGAVRIIALSGFGRQEDKAKAKAAGFDAFLVKPVDPVYLLEALRST